MNSQAIGNTLYVKSDPVETQINADLRHCKFHQGCDFFFICIDHK